jgi:hypothetical protein
LSSTKKSILLNFQKDRLSNLLFERFGYKGIIFFFIIPLTLICISSIYEGSFFKIEIAGLLNLPPNPLINDYVFWSLFLLVILTSLLTRNLFNSISYYFYRLWNRQIFSEDVSLQDYKKFFNKYEDRANNKLIYLFGSIFMVLYIINKLIFPHSTKFGIIGFSDQKYFPITCLVFHIVFGYLSFLIGVLAWKIYTLVNCMRSICEPQNFILRLQPLNPDNSAGLKPLGELSFKLSKILVSFGVVIVLLFSLGLIKRQLYKVMMLVGTESLIIYVFLSIFLFFYPLLSAHNLMRTEKDVLLDKLSSKLGVMYSEFYGELTQLGVKIEKDKTEHLVSLRELCLEAGKMPVWPFDTQTLMKFLGTTIAPIFMITLEIAISNYLKI